MSAVERISAFLYLLRLDAPDDFGPSDEMSYSRVNFITYEARHEARRHAKPAGSAVYHFAHALSLFTYHRSRPRRHVSAPTSQAFIMNAERVGRIFGRGRI